MKAFLRQVVDHYLDEPSGMDGLVFVFPNRRSIAFFKKYIKDALAERGSGKPVLAPVLLPVNEFFEKLSGETSADRISLLLELYDCYTKLYKKAESLDDFIYWGDVILSDFNDIDKYMVNARGLYTNLKDYRSIEANYDFLTDRQREAIERLVDHFRQPSQEEQARGRDAQGNFYLLWQLLYPLYESFRERLRSEGQGYEGMIYRDLAEREGDFLPLLQQLDPMFKGCVFVGLNALSRSEATVMEKLGREGLAQYCWDYSEEMIGDPGEGRKKSVASLFVSENLKRFPQAFQPQIGGVALRPKDGDARFHFVGVPSATGQARILGQILSRVSSEERGLDFSIVLPDESFLMSTLSCIPEEVDAVNVTMGYPLAASEWNAMMRSILAAQLSVRKGEAFYRRAVYEVFSNSIFKAVLSKEEADLCGQIRKEQKIYIPSGDFASGELTALVFTPAMESLTALDPEGNASRCARLAEYLKAVCHSIARRLNPETDSLQLECALKYYSCVNRLAALRLPILPKTFIHLVEQLVAGMSVPFEGEPLGGMQLMGPLETRALDFKHIVILNANEGVFPRRSAGSSFIPPELRRAFELPTYEYKDGVWAYYFYRMVARAEDVWMVYDSRQEASGGGEPSRFISQLKYMYGQQCSYEELVADSQLCDTSVPDEIPKTAEDIDLIFSKPFSASKIQSYVKCPAKFYYQVVCGLKDEDELSDNLDARLLGDLCHHTLCLAYTNPQALEGTEDFETLTRKFEFKPHDITAEYLDSLLSEEGKQLLRKRVNAEICCLLRCPEVSGRNLVYAEVALEYIAKVLETDRKKLLSRASFRIVALEMPCNCQICGENFTGFIDRLDMFEDGVLRVVDYKTGKDSQLALAAENSPEMFFDVSGKSSDYKAAFQFFVYDRMLEQQSPKVVPEFSEVRNAMYSMKDIFTEEIVDNPEIQIVNDGMKEKLTKIFEELRNSEKGFVRNTHVYKLCDYCNFINICGNTAKQEDKL